jgi:uncharacterized RDD family membrane protein YckC
MLPRMADPHDAPAPAAADERPATLLGWRLLALLYDLFPALALWMLAASLFVVAFTITGHTTHENIAPFSGWQWALWACCWVLTGLYATWSWRRGGQTLGMRPWRIAVTGDDVQPPSLPSLWVRYAVASASLGLAGLGFWWALIDRDRLTWHDRASGTRMIRRSKR